MVGRSGVPAIRFAGAQGLAPNCDAPPEEASEQIDDSQANWEEREDEEDDRAIGIWSVVLRCGGNRRREIGLRLHAEFDRRAADASRVVQRKSGDARQRRQPLRIYAAIYGAGIDVREI